MTKKSTIAFRYVDLFAGVGGFAAALNTLGGDVLAASEIDEYAASTYEKNFLHDPRGDVAELANRSQDLSAYHVLTGGFPCQPFSKSGAQKGTGEARGTLFGEIEKIVSNTTPLLIILENVKNLAGPRHIDEWKRIVAFLRDSGYRVSSSPAEFSPHLLSKAKGGRPQHRVRIFITATWNPGPDGKNTEEPEPVVTMKAKTFPSWNLVRDLPLQKNVDARYNLSKDEVLWLNAWDELLIYWNKSHNGKFPGLPLWSDFWVDAPPIDLSSNPIWKQKFILKNIDFYQINKAFIDTWLKKWSVREAFPNSRRKFEWQAGDMPSVWDGLIQFRPSGIRVKKPTYVPALVALNQTPVYGPYKRRITEMEAARLQGFPKNWIPGEAGASKTYKQMGNAVNIGVIAHVFREHCKRDAEILMKHKSGRQILKSLERFPENPDVVFASWGHTVRPTK